jgi:hypothetical protein
MNFEVVAAGGIEAGPGAFGCWRPDRRDAPTGDISCSSHGHRSSEAPSAPRAGVPAAAGRLARAVLFAGRVLAVFGLTLALVWAGGKILLFLLGVSAIQP